CSCSIGSAAWAWNSRQWRMRSAGVSAKGSSRLYSINPVGLPINNLGRLVPMTILPWDFETQLFDNDLGTARPTLPLPSYPEYGGRAPGCSDRSPPGDPFRKDPGPTPLKSRSDPRPPGNESPHSFLTPTAIPIASPIRRLPFPTLGLSHR